MVDFLAFGATVKVTEYETIFEIKMSTQLTLYLASDFYTGDNLV